MNSCIKSEGPGTDNGGVALRSEPAPRGAHWQGPASGRYPRGSTAVADLRRVEVLPDCLLVGKPLSIRKLERGHRAAVPEEPGHGGASGHALSQLSTGGWNAGPSIHLGDGCPTAPPPRSLFPAMPSGGAGTLSLSPGGCSLGLTTEREAEAGE